MSTPFLEASTIGKNYDELLKLLLIGDSGVGKSSIVNTYTEPSAVWDPLFISTIGVDFKVRTCQRCDKVVKLQIWDTAGQERFRSITQSYYRGSNGIILAYDVTDPQSLRHVATVWMKEVERHATHDALLVLVGNKSDLASSCPEQVAATRAMAEQLVEGSQGRIVAHIETSAKTGVNVGTAFTALIDALLEQRSRKRAAAMLDGHSKRGSATHRLSTATALPMGGDRASWCAC